MHRSTSGVLIGATLVVLSLVSGTLAAEADGEPRVTASLVSEKLLLGEPLLFDLIVSNPSEAAVPALLFANGAPPLLIEVQRPDGKQISKIERGTGAKRLALRGVVPRVDPKVQPDKCWQAWEVVRFRYAFVLLDPDDDHKFLPPGDYAILVTVDPSGEKIVAPKLSLSIKDLAEKDRGVLASYTPALAPLLEGSWKNPFEKLAIIESDRMTQYKQAHPELPFDENVVRISETLHRDYAHLPYLQHVDFYQLPVMAAGDEFLKAAAKYLRDYPDSPYADVTLFRMARAQINLGRGAEALRTFNTLRVDHRHSWFVRESERYLDDAAKSLAENSGAPAA